MIHIRLVNSNEATQLQNLNNEVMIDNVKYDPDLIEDWANSEAGKLYFEDIVKGSNNICFVAEIQAENKLVGYIVGSPKEFSYRKSKYLEIDNMGVIPEYQSQGIGQQLIEKILQWAREKGYQKVFVSSYFKNEKAIKFYQKCGFEPIDVGLELSLPPIT